MTTISPPVYSNLKQSGVSHPDVETAYPQPGEVTAFYHPTQIPWLLILLIYKKETT